MTPEDAARKCVERIFTETHVGTTGGKLYEIIADAIRAAVAEEREACAKIAEEFKERNGSPQEYIRIMTADVIAKEIRARGNS